VWMQAAALCHTNVAGELVQWCSPNETFWVEVKNEVAKFGRLEELCSRLKGPDARICDLLLGLPLSQARCGDHLDQAIG
jgi:hypothetical protein